MKGDVNYKAIAEEVYLATRAKEVMAEMGITPPKETYRTHTIMGRTFDPEKADAYSKSFAIGRSA